MFNSFLGKDTVRTDREHPYFAGENNSNLDVLQDILLTHVMYDFDLGNYLGNNYVPQELDKLT